MKKNQVVIYAIALMLVAAGYLSFTAKTDTVETSSSNITNEVSENENNIGDAKLVSSNMENNVINTEMNNTINNTTNNINNEITNTKNDLVNKTESASSQAIMEKENMYSEYFSKSKLERDTMYSQTIETYQKILDNSNAPETQKNIATEQITKVNEVKNSIMICENLIQTKGFKNSVIFVNGNSISVIVQAETLETEDIAQIQNIIAREMNANIDDIHISKK